MKLKRATVDRRLILTAVISPLLYDGLKSRGPLTSIWQCPG